MLTVIKTMGTVVATLLGCLGLLVAFLLVTIPSIIYGISGYILLPVGCFLVLFMGSFSSIRASLIAFKLSTVFLIIVVPVILYFYVWEFAGWIFFFWMIIYFILRIYSGVHKKEVIMIQAWREFASFTEKNPYKYIRNHPKVIAISIVLSIISITVGYLIGGSVGLRIGIIVAILNWWLTPYTREAIVEIRSLEENKNKSNQGDK